MADDVQPIAIKVTGVSKAFKLPHEKQTSIKGVLINALRSGKRTYERQQVLHDVSFEVKQGEFFGIVGRNGSGKSTLLKMLAGIYAPSAGTIETHGKLTPFIELGVGFNPELTGRENIFLSGALLGYNRKEMLAMYDDIVSFAELERFMDQKLKNYSSGMQVRLAFSIAIRAQSDILILDEVLAVGDEAFQQKCIDVFENYKADKQTIVLVTHDMSIVKRFCTRAMLVDKGEIKVIGNPSDVANTYSMLNDETIDASVAAKNAKHEGQEHKLKLRLTTEKGTAASKFSSHSTAYVRMQWPKEAGVQNIGVALVKNSGEFIFGTNTFARTKRPSDGSAVFTVKLDLVPGKYHIMAGLFGETERHPIDFVSVGPEFIVKAAPHDESFDGLVLLPHEWKEGV